MEWLISALHPWGGQGAGTVSLELGMKHEIMATTHAWLHFAKFLSICKAKMVVVLLSISVNSVRGSSRPDWET